MTCHACRWLVLVSGLSALSCIQPAPTVAQTPAVARTLPDSNPGRVPKPAVKPGTVTAISITEFFPLQEAGGALVYDVRPAIFHALGHIPGTTSWPKSKFEAGLATHEPEIRAAAKAGRPVVLYCTDRECPDSRAVASRLAALGHSVAVMEGGYGEWKAAGLPTD